MASWGSYVFELCRINANQGLTAEIDWNYTSWSRRCRKILIGLVVRGAKTVVVRGKNRILTRNRKKPEMTVPISHYSKCVQTDMILVGLKQEHLPKHLYTTYMFQWI